MASRVRGMNTRLAAIWAAKNPNGAAGYWPITVVIAIGSKIVLQCQAAIAAVAMRPRTMRRIARRNPIKGTGVAAPPIFGVIAAPRRWQRPKQFSDRATHRRGGAAEQLGASAKSHQNDRRRRPPVGRKCRI